MPTNPLKLILNLQKSIHFNIADIEGNNKANKLGSGLELYIRNLFIDSVDLDKDRIDYSDDFSYIGNSSNPPDLILKNSDAVEIKKVESLGSSLALNSSSPKNKLYANSELITKQCRDCEDWSEKDMLYIIGTVKNKILQKLWLVYGDCYSADNELYENTKKEFEWVDSMDADYTSNKIDSLNITTYSSKKGWAIKSPSKVFDYLPVANFGLNFLVLEVKYNSFNSSDRNKIKSNNEISVSDVKIKDPNNPAKLLDAKLIQLCLNKN